MAFPQVVPHEAHILPKELLDRFERSRTERREYWMAVEVGVFSDEIRSDRQECSRVAAGPAVVVAVNEASGGVDQARRRRAVDPELDRPGQPERAEQRERDGRRGGIIANRP